MQFAQGEIAHLNTLTWHLPQTLPASTPAASCAMHRWIWGIAYSCARASGHIACHGLPMWLSDKIVLAVAFRLVGAWEAGVAPGHVQASTLEAAEERDDLATQLEERDAALQALQHQLGEVCTHDLPHKHRHAAGDVVWTTLLPALHRGWCGQQVACQEHVHCKPQLVSSPAAQSCRACSLRPGPWVLQAQQAQQDSAAQAAAEKAQLEGQLAGLAESQGRLAAECQSLSDELQAARQQASIEAELRSKVALAGTLSAKRSSRARWEDHGAPHLGTHARCCLHGVLCVAVAEATGLTCISAPRCRPGQARLLPIALGGWQSSARARTQVAELEQAAQAAQSDAAAAKAELEETVAKQDQLYAQIGEFKQHMDEVTEVLDGTEAARAAAAQEAIQLRQACFHAGFRRRAASQPQAAQPPAVCWSRRCITCTSRTTAKDCQAISWRHS